jgi:hypothetical protein
MDGKGGEVGSERVAFEYGGGGFVGRLGAAAGEGTGTGFVR